MRLSWTLLLMFTIPMAHRGSTNLIRPLTATDHGKQPISAMCLRARAMQAQGSSRMFAVYRVCTPSASLFKLSAQVPSGHHRWEK